MTQTDPRKRFFNEEGGMLPPFVDPAWRGCLIDRDRYAATNMPEMFFEAILAVAAPSELRFARYTPDHPVETLPANWTAFRDHVFVRENWSLEFVMFDASEQWAILADPDVTVFGAAPELADRIDAYLAKKGTSLVKMTDDEYGPLDPATQPGSGTRSRAG
ncbi:hypothetical protein [Noviluteimonas gilva]|uniref:hypothetical protein n=1 Tax=Noviluteimonas gilva TaxID=2682097 RepID=UPI001E3042BA|nr:hypothetical protein [Lysobacter gilvus]